MTSGASFEEKYTHYTVALRARCEMLIGACLAAALRALQISLRSMFA